MRKFIPLLAALSAGLALKHAFVRRQKVEMARKWAHAGPGTALVTGASSGIGAAFARELAHRGYDLVVVARREARLMALAEQIKQAHGVKVEILTADLDNPVDVERVAQTIDAKADLKVLVNNAGFGLGGDYSKVAVEDSLRMVRVHVLASMRLARAALPGMIARGNGGIINVSSMAAFMPVGGNTVYGATKAYLNFFSEALQEELSGTGVRVQALCPGFTYTEIHDKSGRPNLPGFLWLEAEDVVVESLDGLQEGSLYVIPGTVYRLGAAFTNYPLFAPFIRLARSRAMANRQPVVKPA